jgi:hypothetical protein
MKFSFLLFVATLTPVAAIAQEKPLDTVLKVPNIEKSCGSFFATTTFGGGKEIFLFYRIKGSAKNDVIRQSDASIEVKQTDQRMAEETEPGKWLFLMNDAAAKEAASCFGTQ